MSIDATARALARIEGTRFSHRCRNGSMRNELVTFSSNLGWILLPRTQYPVPSIECPGCRNVAVWVNETSAWRVLSEGFLR